MSKTTPPIAPIIPLLIGMIAISFSPIFVRISDAPAGIQGMYRMLFTVLIMLPFGAKHIRTIKTVSRKDWLLLAVAGFFLALHFLLWMESINYTSIASSTIILALEPVFVMIGGYFLFKERARKLAVIGLILALVGAFTVGSGDIGLSQTAFTGDLLSFLGTLAVAVNMLIAKRILSRVSSYLYSLIVFTITVVCFAIYNLAIGVSFTSYPGKEWLLSLLLAIIPTVLGHMIFNWLLQYVKTATISMSVLAEPVGASILGMIIFHEMITEFQIVGGVFIMVGLLLYLRSEQQMQIPISDAKVTN